MDQPGRPVFPHGPGDDPESQATPTRPDTNIIRPMPTGQSDQSFDALAMKSVLSRAKDTSRYEAPPPPEPEHARRPFPVKAFIVVVAVMLVVGAAAGFVWVNFLRPTGPDDDTLVQPSTTASEAVGSSSPQQAVRGYLEALAEGDIDKALGSEVEPGPGARTLLSAEAYAQMPEESRPRQIEILTTDTASVEVEVRYRLGDSTVETTYRTQRQADDTYKLARGSVTVTWQLSGGKNMPLFVNGVEVDHTQAMELVPGTYQLTTGLPYLEYPASASVTIQSVDYSEDPTFPVTAEITQEGRQVLLERAQASLQDCLVEKSLEPKGCPNVTSVAQAVDPESIDWRVVNDPWSNFNPTLTAEDQSVAAVSVPLDLTVSLTLADGRAIGRQPVDGSARLTASLLGKDPQTVNVEWHR